MHTNSRSPSFIGLWDRRWRVVPWGELEARQANFVPTDARHHLWEDGGTPAEGQSSWGDCVPFA